MGTRREGFSKGAADRCAASGRSIYRRLLSLRFVRASLVIGFYEHGKRARDMLNPKKGPQSCQFLAGRLSDVDKRKK